MPKTLFISHFPLSSSRPNWVHSCSRVAVQPPVFVVCSSLTSSSSLPNQPGDPEWMKLAQSIAPPDSSPTDQEEPSRPSPKWIFPDGDPKEVGDNSPWLAWNAAQSNEQQVNEQELAPRDPKKETDIWRSAARDLVSSDSGPGSDSNVTNAKTNDIHQPAYQQTNDDDDEQLKENSSSQQVWGMAREVTGEMSSLQNQLLAELNTYDPEQNTDQYRDIASELVGPSNDEPWEDKEPVRPDDQKDAGTGWNPDVDWMRFDDVGREKLLAKEAAQRRSVEDAARQSMQNVLDGSSTTKQESNDSSNDDTTSFNDSDSFSSDSGSTADFTVNGDVPGFVKNRFRSDGVYGSSWSGAEEETEKLRNEGYDLRDPKSDSDSWRSAAKDLVIKIPTLETDNESETAEQAVDIEEGTITEVIDVKEESNVWSSWREGSIKWNQVNSKIEERDPKKEVDMWRTSARDLLNDTEIETDKGSSSRETSSSSSGEEVNEDTGVWAKWRQANQQWEKSVIMEENQRDSSKQKQNQQSDGNMDWGAGLGKTNSERGAWDSWNRVGGFENNSGQDKSMWWKTRYDAGSEGSGSERSELVARETRVEGKREERLGKNLTVDEWRSFAKEINVNPVDVDEDADNEK